MKYFKFTMICFKVMLSLTAVANQPEPKLNEIISQPPDLIAYKNQLPKWLLNSQYTKEDMGLDLPGNPYLKNCESKECKRVSRLNSFYNVKHEFETNSNSKPIEIPTRSAAMFIGRCYSNSKRHKFPTSLVVDLSDDNEGYNPNNMRLGAFAIVNKYHSKNTDSEKFPANVGSEYEPQIQIYDEPNPREGYMRGYSRMPHSIDGSQNINDALSSNYWDSLRLEARSRFSLSTHIHHASDRTILERNDRPSYVEIKQYTDGSKKWYIMYLKDRKYFAEDESYCKIMIDAF